MSRNFETHGSQRCEVKRIKPIFVDKGNNGTRLRAAPRYLKYISSHFFSKTDLGQYLLKGSKTIQTDRGRTKTNYCIRKDDAWTYRLQASDAICVPHQ